MRFFLKSFLFFTTFLLLQACNRSLSSDELNTSVKVDSIYYTQVSMMYEKGRHKTTNYRRGKLLPINTPVKLIDISRKHIKVEIQPAGYRFIVVNVVKHTGDDTSQAFEKLFGLDKVNLNGLTALEKKNVLAGKVDTGMRKKAVLAAIGHPPNIRTPSLDDDQWTYWSSRYNKFIVHFSNDRVVKVVD